MRTCNVICNIVNVTMLHCNIPINIIQFYSCSLSENVPIIFTVFFWKHNYVFKVVISLARGSKCSAVEQIKMTAHISQRSAFVGDENYRSAVYNTFVQQKDRAISDFFE